MLNSVSLGTFPPTLFFMIGSVRNQTHLLWFRCFLEVVSSSPLAFLPSKGFFLKSPSGYILVVKKNDRIFAAPKLLSRNPSLHWMESCFSCWVSQIAYCLFLYRSWKKNEPCVSIMMAWLWKEMCKQACIFLLTSQLVEFRIEMCFLAEMS